MTFSRGAPNSFAEQGLLAALHSRGRPYAVVDEPSTGALLAERTFLANLCGVPLPFDRSRRGALVRYSFATVGRFAEIGRRDSGDIADNTQLDVLTRTLSR